MDYEELIKKQNEVILAQNNIIQQLITDKNELTHKCIKFFIAIAISLIIAFTVIISVFYIAYFTSDYTSEIEAKNTTTTNYNERKEYINVNREE